MKPLIILGCVCSLLLVACGQDPAPKLFDAQRQALDKAKAQSDTVQRQAEQQRQDVDQQTQ